MATQVFCIRRLAAMVVLLGGGIAATCPGPCAAEPPDPCVDRPAFVAWQAKARRQLAEMLGISNERTALQPESRGRIEMDDMVVEKWIYTSEPGSRIPAALYLPKQAASSVPGVVLTFGHGGSKSQPDYNYMAQTFAKLGIACLAADPIGEEERNLRGAIGTRAHDPVSVHEAAWNVGRPIMGKMVWDTMRGVDFLRTRSDIDPARIGVAGNSLGGAVAGWMAVLDPRLRFAIVSGWAFAPMTEQWGKYCTRMPNLEMRKLLTWPQYLSLAAPHCSMLIANGDADTIIDRDGAGDCWRDTRRAVEQVGKIYACLGRPEAIRCWFEPGGGHRPYPAHPEVLAWLVDQVRPCGWTGHRISQMPRVNFGHWANAAGIRFEPLYDTELHLRGATVLGVDIRYLDQKRLAVLRPEEVGRAEFTLEGWLSQVKRNAASAGSR